MLPVLAAAEHVRAGLIRAVYGLVWGLLRRIAAGLYSRHNTAVYRAVLGPIVAFYAPMMLCYHGIVRNQAPEIRAARVLGRGNTPTGSRRKAGQEPRKATIITRKEGGNMAYRNSPVIGDGGLNATPAELSTMTRYAIDLIEATPPDLFNLEEVKAAAMDYFNSCERHGIKPGNLGLYARLGLSKQDIHNILTGKSKNKVSPAVLDFIQKLKNALSSYREAAAMNGKINPVTAIFWAKNFDGMEDSTRIEVSADSSQRANLTPEQIARQIEQDIPIDSDYREV